MNFWLWLLLGIISILGGFFALTNPIAATLAATTLAAWVFLIVGGVQVIAGFGAEGVWSKIGNILIGVAAIYVGYSIATHPGQGALLLTSFIAFAFLFGGIFKIALGFSPEGAEYRWVFILSGLVSVVLAIMILGRFPASALAVPGIILGVELLSNGISLMTMAFVSRRAQSA